ncbi:MAG TPA: hypothetical protein VMP10_02875, partial [Chloroflexota bacterium]|nr:hypothetical protein [Chloroflexota bacterium]
MLARSALMFPRPNRADVACIVFLTITVAVFFADVLIGDRVMVPIDNLYRAEPWRSLAAEQAVGIPHNDLIGDQILQNVAWKTFARNHVLRGELPLWNPYEFAGLPFLAGGQSGTLYPLGVVFYLLPVLHAYGWFLAIHTWLAGAFTFLFLRVLGLRPPSALFGGIAFAYSAFLIVSYVWPMIVSAAVWLPLLLLVLELTVRAHERGAALATRLPLVVGGSLVIALEILAGHLEITFYVLATAALYASGRLAWPLLARRQWRSAASASAEMLAMPAIGFLLAGVQLVPFAELIAQNVRMGQVSYQDVIGYALPSRQIATFLLPEIFGSPTRHHILDITTWTWREVGLNAHGSPTDPPGT